MKKIVDHISAEWYKYLLEILVIVIGIYGAIAVDNWNNDRLQRKEEIEILKSVNRDLQLTIEEFRYLNEYRELIIISTKQIMALSIASNPPTEVLDSLIFGTFRRPTFNSKQGAIELLFTSGKINSITNDSIREKLIPWPGSVDDMLEEEVIAGDIFLNLYYPVVAEYIVVNDIVKYDSLSSSFFGSFVKQKSYTKPPIEADYDGLLRNKAFFNHLRIRAMSMTIIIQESEILIGQAQEIMTQIEKEIHR